MADIAALLEGRGGKFVGSKGGKGPLAGLGGKGGKGGKLAGGKMKRAAISRSARAGLHFPVGRLHRFLKRRVAISCRVSATSAVYLAAILEYLAAEMLELTGNCAKDHKSKRISPRHLQLAIRNDEELDRLVKGTISGGGVAPQIHPSLSQKNEKAKKKKKNGLASENSGKNSKNSKKNSKKFQQHRGA